MKSQYVHAPTLFTYEVQLQTEFLLCLFETESGTCYVDQDFPASASRHMPPHPA